ncbi:oligosaccharide flippase family protein [Colwellia sp. BRX8-4]|uniref:lipopolysaccharide biosynthesis protein n=1 Tax=Colwellia sp. BRX8-4 TaxID=2759836 RepID=UPI0015F43B5B|nr:oligosaccharide flippase family protein [Colwellia sp. BRX8-4]MBA6370480.1 oligosaccharide flippase family protein [Colwellia sp. BRX8-4]
MLVKLFSQSFVGSLVYALTQWLIIACISKLLSIEATGVYATALGIVVVVNVFFNFGIRQITFTSGTEEVLKLGKAILFSQLTGLIVASCILVVFYPELLLLGVFIYLHKIIESFSEYQYGVYQRSESHYKIAISRIIRSLTYTATFVVTLYLTHSLSLSTLAMAISNAASFFIVDKFRFKNSDVKDKKRALNVYFSLGLPLAITAFLLSLRSVLPRFFIENEMSFEYVGMFVSYLYLVNAAGIAIQSWSQVISPKISIAFNNNDFTQVKSIFLKGGVGVFLYSLVFAIGFYFLGKESVKLIYSDELNLETSTITAILLYMFTTYIASYLGYCVTAIKEFKSQPRIFLLLLLICIIFVHLSAQMHNLDYIIYALAGVSILQVIILSILFYKKVYQGSYGRG